MTDLRKCLRCKHPYAPSIERGFEHECPHCGFDQHPIRITVLGCWGVAAVIVITANVWVFFLR
jgi:hypothetical protein